MLGGYKVLLADTAGLRDDRRRDRGRGRAPGAGLGGERGPAPLAGGRLGRRRCRACRTSSGEPATLALITKRDLPPATAGA